jgi:hypothetical protein
VTAFDLDACVAQRDGEFFFDARGFGSGDSLEMKRGACEHFDAALQDTASRADAT